MNEFEKISRTKGNWHNKLDKKRRGNERYTAGIYAIPYLRQTS